MDNNSIPSAPNHQSATSSSKIHSVHPGCPDSLSCLADSDAKPRDTFATIIRCAILSTPSKRMTLNCIYNAIEEKYPYYRDAGPGWKNTVRHVLSTSQQFEKSRRPITEPGKGGYWSVNETRAKSDNPRTRRTNRTVARKDPVPIEHHSATIWNQPQQHAMPPDYSYLRSLPPSVNEAPTEADRYSPHLGPSHVVAAMPQYSEHPSYQAVPPMTHLPPVPHHPQYPQPNGMVYPYDKPPERPGWLTEVSWSNAPLGNVTAQTRH